MIVKYYKLYVDAAGESHWDDIEVKVEERSFAPPAQAIEISEPEKVERVMFLRLRSGWDEPIHPTPVAQRLICLAGTVHVTASDGEFRTISRGDVWHMEDKFGKGHHTKVTSEDDFEAVIIQYE
nr:cupin [Ruegeria atlantica]